MDIFILSFWRIRVQECGYVSAEGFLAASHYGREYLRKYQASLLQGLVVPRMWYLYHGMVHELDKGLEIETHTDRDTG